MEPAAVETTCGTLLRELQHIWDEVGESDDERDRLLLQLEQECLEVYRRKVDNANHARARLHRAIADAEAELASLVSLLGERPVIIENRQETLKEQFAAIYPHLEEMRHRKVERAREIADVKLQIQKISGEISGVLQQEGSPAEQELSLRKLEEYQLQLQTLQKEKSDRLNKVMDNVNAIHDLCAVLSTDFIKTVAEIHPSLKDSDGGQSRSISNETLDRLHSSIQQLQEEKKERMLKLQDFGASLIELWNLMDTPSEEQHCFQHVTCHLAATEDEITTPGALALEVIEQAEAEVERLGQLKISKMKELVLKKRAELEEICRRAHMECDASIAEDKIVASIDSGILDPSELLSSMEEQIGKAKEEAYSRKEIMEKIERWMAACEEESWLEDYNKDENRYSASRGAHLILKRAERARATVNKLPALVESLAAKARGWEDERGTPFLYDGVSLLSMLEEYNFLRQEKEEEKRRMRDHKRLQEQLITEQEVMFGSRPSPNKTGSVKKNPAGVRANVHPANRRLSLGGSMLPGTPELMPRVNGVTPSRLAGGAATKENKKERARPANIVTLAKEDSAGGVHHVPVLDRDLGARKPLSPVPLAPAKTNIDEKNQNWGDSPAKPAVVKSNLPSTTNYVSVQLEQELPIPIPVPRDPVVKQEFEYSFEERRMMRHCFSYGECVTAN